MDCAFDGHDLLRVVNFGGTRKRFYYENVSIRKPYVTALSNKIFDFFERAGLQR